MEQAETDKVEGEDLNEVFYFDDHRYSVSMTRDGLTWTRVSTTGRKHFVPFREIIGLDSTQRVFKIVCVTSKDKVGLRREKSFSFESRSSNPKETVTKWVAAIKKSISAIRPVPKKKLFIVVNPFSGRKKGEEVWKLAQRWLTLAEIPFEALTTTRGGHAYEHVQKLNVSEYYGIVCVSGDGLLNEVVNGIMAREDYRDALANFTLGIIPAGSGNGLAASLFAPDPLTSTYGIICGLTHPIDLFTMLQDNERKYGFLSISWATMSVIDLESEGYRWLGSLRFDVKGVAEVLSCNTYKGKISYIPNDSIQIAKKQQIPIQDENLHSTDKPPLDLINNEGDGETEKWKVLEGEWSFFCACSTPKVLISAGPLATKSHISDGTIDLILAPKLGRVDLTLLLAGIEDGSVAGLPFVQYIKTRAFKLEPDLNHLYQAPISLDGERVPNSTIIVQVHQALARVFYDFDGNIPEGMETIFPEVNNLT